jgi:cyanophycinase
MLKQTLAIIAWVVVAACLAAGQTASFRYSRSGNANDVTTKWTAGYALMGGGSDLDEAFRWLCNKGGGGDFLILRAAGDDAYNSYVAGLCRTNSVATLIIPDRQSAADSRVAEIIRSAEAIFIAGGNQARYINGWTKTPVADALNAAIAEGKPIGGTSAGLAVLGQYIYSAEGDAPDDADLTSAEALANPYFARVTVRRDFLKIDLLRDTLTDTHFAKRDRMGRSLTFLARIIQDGWSSHPREIAVDEKSAALVENDGQTRVVGSGRGAYFISTERAFELCSKSLPLTFNNIAVYRAAAGADFNLKEWSGKGGTRYELSIVKGRIESSQANGEVY